MKRRYRSGTEFEAKLVATEQIKTLIDGLSRGVQLLDSEIATEQQSTGIKDQRDAAYSLLARSLIARRDNLTDTITALHEQLVTVEGLTVSHTVGDELLLPA